MKNWTQIKTNYNCNYATFLCALLQATRSKEDSTRA